MFISHRMEMSHEHGTMHINGTMTGMGDMAAMHMSLFWGKDVTILFDGWPDNRLGMYILSLIFVFFLAFAVEVLSASPLTTAVPFTSPVVGGLTLAAIYALRVAIAYLVMLAVMSFNIGVFIVAVVGHALGYFLVKFRTLAAPPPPEIASDNTPKV